jgi:hypothetical protein
MISDTYRLSLANYLPLARTAPLHRTSPFSQWRDDGDQPTVAGHNYYIAANGECP